jgi:hypothetical protein
VLNSYNSISLDGLLIAAAPADKSQDGHEQQAT